MKQFANKEDKTVSFISWPLRFLSDQSDLSDSLIFQRYIECFSVENPHDGKTFENFTRFEWGVEVGVVTTFMLRLFVPHEFDMYCDRDQYLVSMITK